MVSRYLVLFILALFASWSVIAAPGTTTYQAKIFKPDGTPLESPNVSFRFSILDPVGTCILYSENFNTVNMSGSGGLVYFSLGSGSKVFPTSGTISFADVFDNYGGSIACASGGPGYSPLPADVRKIAMQFNDGSGWQTLPAMKINSVPYAMYSNDTQKFNGKYDTDFVQVGNVPTCAGGEYLTFNGSSFTCALDVGASGTIASVSVAGPISTTGGINPTISISKANAITDGYLSFADWNLFNNKQTATSAAIISTLGYAPVSSAALGSFASANSIDLGSASATGTLAIARLPALSGDVTSVSGSNTLTLVNSGVTSATYTKVTVNAKGLVTSGSSLSSLDVTTALGYTPLSAVSAGITSLNGSSSATQTFANGTAGTAPLFSTVNGVHTLNIPLASAGSVTAGLLSNADYLSFSNKITSSAASVAQVLGYVPASSTVLGNYLATANNLSDLSSSATARANLGLGTLATANGIDLGSASATGILSAARLPAFAGDVTSVSGSNVLTLANSGVSAATYAKVTVNAKGLVTNGLPLTNADVTTALGYAPVSATGGSQWNTSGTTINYTTGNVGIGTADPTSPLSIYNPGASGNLNAIDFTTAGGGLAAQFFVNPQSSTSSQFFINFPNPSSGTGNWLTYRYGSINNKWFFGDDGTNAYFQTSHNMYFQPGVGGNPVQSNTGAVLTVTNSNVGVGTTSPNSPLEIATSNAFSGSMNIPRVRVQSTDNSGGTGAGIAFSVDGSTSADGLVTAKILGIRKGGFGVGDLAFFTNSSGPSTGDGSSERMRILANGNVGVGVSSPAYTLDVSGVVNAKGLKINGVDIGSVTSASVISALGYTPADSATTVSSQWATSGTSINYVSGNVGIGISNPVYTLDMTNATDGVRLPAGTTLQQPTGMPGVIRYNSDTTALEFNDGSSWSSLKYKYNGTTLSTNTTFTVSSGFQVFDCNPGAAGMTATLPATASLPLGWWIELKKNFAARNVSIVPSDAVTIDGASSVAITQLETGWYRLTWTGSVWKAILVQGTHYRGLPNSPMYLVAAAKTTTGDGNLIQIQGSTVYEGNGGTVNILAGPANSQLTNTYTGGGILLRASYGVNNGDGGSVVLNGGKSNSDGTGTGSGGAVVLQGGQNSSGYGAVTLNATGGNVGIGTTAPTNPLSVSGTVDINGNILFKRTNNSNASFDGVTLQPYVANNAAGAETSGLSIATKTAGVTSWAVDFADNIYTYVPINVQATSTYLNRNVAGSGAHSLAFYKRRPSGSVLTNDNLAWIPAYGHTGSGWSPTYSSAIGMRATEAHSGSAAGGEFWIETTPNGTTTPKVNLVVSNNGNVGIGATSPTAKLEVVGQMRSINVSGTAQVNAAASVDWNNGNTQSMSVDCATTSFTNMLDGGVYVLAVTNTGTSTCVFSQAGLTFYFSPANGARTSGQRTVYTFQRIGSDVYVSWIKGFQ